MLPSIGLPELLIILVLAIVVVGPKDMPKMMRKISGFLRQVRAMGDEFKGAFNDMAKDTELDELRKEINDLRDMADPRKLLGGDLESEMRSLDTDIRSAAADIPDAPHPRVSKPVGGDDGKT